MNMAARANTAAKAGRNLVVAQVDVCAARRTIGRYGRFADFVLALAFKALNRQASPLTPGAAKFFQKRGSQARTAAGRNFLFCPKC